jgi:hypothetical protein
LDVVELDLTTLGAGKILAEKQKAQLKWVAVNHLEYLSFNIDKPPFIELVILFRTMDNIPNIINTQIEGSSDSFLKEAGNECLAFLKAE